MFLERIDIAWFRGIQKLSIRLDQTTVLIGENNAGKSTILDAVQKALGGTSTKGRFRFVEYDHHLRSRDSQASDSEPIEIILTFSEQPGKEWPDSAVRKLQGVIQYDDSGRYSVTLRVRCRYDGSLNESVPEWDFLRLDKGHLDTNTWRYRKALQLLVPVFNLKSKRDPKDEFKPRSTFWGPFVQTLSMDPAKVQDLEEDLADLNQKIIDAHESFAVIEERLQEMADIIPLPSDPVKIEALQNRVLNVLSNTLVSLSSSTGARIPIWQHGEGTQSLAIFFLFVAFLQKTIGRQDPSPVSPILTLEEPEAHLHPSAAHSVARLLEGQLGQSIIATHSGDFIANVAPPSLRRLRRKDGRVSVHQVIWDTFEPKDRNRIDHHIRTVRGNILFARCWLLVEGKTDRMVFERCAVICKKDLIREGVYCVKYVHIGGLRALIRFAKQIGIEWFIVADGDDAGNKYVKKAKKELEGDDEGTHIFQLENALDVVLCMEGYGRHYEQACTAPHFSQTENGLSYWIDLVKHNKDSKTDAAGSAVDEMCEKGMNGVPKAIREIIARSVALAKVA